MDYKTAAMEMVDYLPHPAFCVKEGIIVKANPAAQNRFFQTGMAISDLLETGSEEYATFQQGTLYLTISHCGQSLGTCVSKESDFDLFQLEQVEIRFFTYAGTQGLSAMG